VNRSRLGSGLLVAAGILTAATLPAKILLTQEEALKLAFPGATVEHRTAFLTLAQQKDARKLSGDDDLPAALVNFYVATRDGKEVGTAYFDTHVVRTMPETIMVVVGPSGDVARIEVLSFQEPEEYLPRPRWYAQFSGKVLDDDLSMKRAIRPVTGATLTARATTDAARRVLALHRVLHTPTPTPPAASPSGPPR
jgi:electron transport complex protein RnfG